MPYLMAFPVQDEAQVVVEVDGPPPPGAERAGRAGDFIDRAQQTFDEALGTVKSSAEAFAETFDRLARKPDEATVEFGVKLGATAGAFVVSADAEAHITVTLKWSRGHQPASQLPEAGTGG